MSATRSKQQPDPTVSDQIADIKAEIEAIMKSMQDCLRGLQERLDRLA